MLELRPPLVYEQDGKYIVIGGNMRVSVIREMEGITEIPCIIIPTGLPIRKLKEIAIKDNSKFGEWDYDALADEWKDIPMLARTHGQPASPTRLGKEMNVFVVRLNEHRKVIEIEFTPDEFDFVSKKLRSIADTPEDAVLKVLGL